MNPLIEHLHYIETIRLPGLRTHLAPLEAAMATRGEVSSTDIAPTMIDHLRRATAEYEAIASDIREGRPV